VDIDKIASGVKELLNQSQDKRNSGEVEDRRPAAAGTGPDKVEISSESRKMARMSEDGGVNGVRLEKVNRLRELVQNDQYEIDVEKLADRMLEEVFKGS
jgi:flagellar biosynthesis anti-sigma factor FlgM